MKFKKEGFTLIELLIVISIIAILSMIAFPQYGKYRKSAIRTKYLSFAEVIITSENSYKADYGYYAPFSAKNNKGRDTPILVPLGNNVTERFIFPKYAKVNVYTISCTDFNEDGISLLVYHNDEDLIVTFNSCKDAKAIAVK